MRLSPWVVWFLLLAAAHAQTPPRASEGWYINPYGRIHVLFVFAEIDFDSTFSHLDPEKNPDGSAGWKKGRLPFWRDKIISPTPEGDGFLTTYFRQASFGRFQVTGDYLDSIITLPISQIKDAKGRVVIQEAFAGNHYRQALIRKLNSVETPVFRWGSQLADFDTWTFKGQGQPHLNQPNERIDLVMVIYRNIHVNNLADMSGFVSPGSYGKLWGKETDMHSVFHAQSQIPKVIMRHEFSHMLYGGNNFHTASGGVGTRTFMSQVGGWSNMSASDCASPTWNAWDRERMGWRNPQNQYVVSARCAQTGEEINGVLNPENGICGQGRVILRDFVSSGDALKIPLPHLPDGKSKQYLWIENHQCLEGYLDHDRAMKPGIYAYIQVGKDQTEGDQVFGGDNNYLWPLVAAGNHDFELSITGDTLLRRSGFENPFTGHHYLMRHVRDLNGDGKINVLPDNGPKTEYHLPQDLLIDGKRPPDSLFTFQRYPIFGMQTVRFLEGDILSIGSNPAPVPVYSHGGQQPKSTDNRRIYLNGISIRVLRFDALGQAHLQVRWDDFKVNQNRRWCGDIVLVERLELQPGVEVKLAQGYSPQVAQVAQNLDGRPVFADATQLELLPGSTLSMEARSVLKVESGSTLIVRGGASILMRKRSKIVVESGASIRVEEGAMLPAGFWSKLVVMKPGSRRL
jgi:M6 family metalloprotease-like protein